MKRYLQGGYGQAPGQVDENLRRQAIGSEDVIDVRPADLLKPEMTKLRGEIGTLAYSEEDVLTYAMFPDIGASSSKSEQLRALPDLLSAGGLPEATLNHPRIHLRHLDRRLQEWGLR